MDHKNTTKCRICLDDFDEASMFDLFQELEGSEENIKLSEKVEFCCGVRLRESNEMPTKICSKCNGITRMWFDFRHMCVNSQVYLESSCTNRQNNLIYNSNVGDYFQYLLKDLQTFRAEAIERNKFLEVNLNSTADIIEEDKWVILSPEETDSVSQDIFIKSEPETQSTNGDEMFESDKELEEYLNVSIEEDEQIEYVHEEPTEMIPTEDYNDTNIEENSVVMITTLRRKANAQTKKTKCMPKKSFRPPTPTSFMCAICGNVYKNKNAFNYHMSVHANFKPHECELCGKKFRQVCQYNRHMRRHTGEKPYKCSYCDRHFHDTTDKQRHERTHTKEKPYKCDTCGKAFGLASILRAHEKLHRNEKDFHCFPCGKSFTLRHQLASHRLTKQHIATAKQEQEAQDIIEECE